MEHVIDGDESADSAQQLRFSADDLLIGSVRAAENFFLGYGRDTVDIQIDYKPKTATGPAASMVMWHACSGRSEPRCEAARRSIRPDGCGSRLAAVPTMPGAAL